MGLFSTILEKLKKWFGIHGGDDSIPKPPEPPEER